MYTGGVPGEECTSSMDLTNINYFTVSDFIDNRDIRWNTLAQTKYFKR
jgi:hypothetical protein